MNFLAADSLVVETESIPYNFLALIQCPKCQNSLPDWAQSCQFCGGDVKKVARPVHVQTQAKIDKSGWVWPAYYALAAYWMLSGVLNIGQSIWPIIHPKGDLGSFVLYAYVGIAVGLLTFLVGLGLVLHVEIARGIANFLAGLKIIFGLLGLAGSVLGTLFSGAFGLILVILNIVDIAAAAFAIYLIGETQTRPPNV